MFRFINLHVRILLRNASELIQKLLFSISNGVWRKLVQILRYQFFKMYLRIFKHLLVLYGDTCGAVGIDLALTLWLGTFGVNFFVEVGVDVLIRSNLGVSDFPPGIRFPPWNVPMGQAGLLTEVPCFLHGYCQVHQRGLAYEFVWSFAWCRWDVLMSTI